MGLKAIINGEIAF